jgi:hypothetical protein
MSETSRKRKPITAGELLDRLEKDPAYIARQERWKLEEEENRRKYAESAKPILAELAKYGFHVDSIGRLRHPLVDYRSIIPVLMEWLPKVIYFPLKEDIIRTLSVPWAKPIAAKFMIEEFKKDEYLPYSGVHWAIGNALSIVADDSVAEELCELAQNKVYGQAREMVTVALGNMKKSKELVVPVLHSLLEDPEVCGHALMAFRKLKVTVDSERFAFLLTENRAWVRKLAKKVVK